MKKFHFKLQPLLDHRKRIEDDKKKDLARANYVLTKEKNKLDNFHCILSATQSELKTKESGNLNIAEILFYQSYVLQLRQVINHQIKRIQEIFKMVEKKRQELIEASKNKKVIERLKEKEYEKYMKGITVFEQKFIDDIAINRYIRRDTLDFKQLEN